MLGRPLAPLAILAVAQISACAWVDEDAIADAEPLTIRATYPADGAEAVDPLTQIDLCFSAALDPRSFGTFDAILSSGLNVFDTEVAIQLFPWQPPGGLGPLPDAPWCEGSVLSIRPRSALRPGTRYRVRVRPSPIGWAGERVDTDVEPWIELEDGTVEAYLELRAAGAPGDEAPARPEPPPPITLGDLYAEDGPFDPARGLCTCHRQPYGLARDRLDLSSPEAAFRALVLDPTPSSTGFPKITPHQPSESFLIQKLVRDADGEPLHAVRGSAMPLNGPMPYRDMALLARWIEDGALP